MLAWLFSLLISAFSPNPTTAPANTPDKDKVTQPAPGGKGDQGGQKTIIVEDIYIG